MDLTQEELLHGYTLGIFPMAEHRDHDEVFWVDPRRRGIMPLDQFHVSRSLARRIRKAEYTITINQDFEGVLLACADRTDTWINAEIHNLYMMLHDKGHANSLEVWSGGTLIGGIYGVTIGAAFFGESMFSRSTDASKIALAYLVRRLNDAGFMLFDTQFITDHLVSLGAIEISRAAYHAKLAEALKKTSVDFTAPMTPSAQDVTQRKTQTS